MDIVMDVRRLAMPGWKVLEARHLTGAENHGGHYVYVDVCDAAGNDLRGTGVHALFGWEGMNEEEKPNPVALDKPTGEPAGNFVLYPGMKAWVEVQGLGLPSERVVGLHTAYPSDGEGNDFGLHSFYVKFGTG